MIKISRSASLFFLLLVSFGTEKSAAQLNDTLFVAEGSTYSFTVDTPEDGGLIVIGTSVEELLQEMNLQKTSKQQFFVRDSSANIKTKGKLLAGDQLVISENGNVQKVYKIAIKRAAKSGKLSLAQNLFTVNTSRDLVLSYTLGQRSPNAVVKIFFPREVSVNLENTSVDIIGRGEVKLKDLYKQSIGRVAANYPYKEVGKVTLEKMPDGRTLVIFSELDLRPANGVDLKIVVKDVIFNRTGRYVFEASYTTAEPEVLSSMLRDQERAVLEVTTTVNDLMRVPTTVNEHHEATYTRADFTWSILAQASTISLMQSLDSGKNWTVSDAIVNAQKGMASIKNLLPNRSYAFRLQVVNGENAGSSNEVYFHTGPVDIKRFGVIGDGKSDDTDKINEAINYLHQTGAGTLLFHDGIYAVRTVHLQSNVWLRLSKGATIMALRGGDKPEVTWFSDKKYRSGLSPTDVGPYENPENWLTKQDVGHSYFRNTMFFGERIDNVKILGNGRMTGNGNLVNGDKVMNNPTDWRCDKMFTFKLCTNIEIGGDANGHDLWYDPARDEPYYIKADSSRNYDIDNMLQIDRGGHFVLLATGSDHIYVHDTYFGKYSTANVRDIYDFMGCNHVRVNNIYSKVSSDDVVKLGSDCSLGFTRPASDYKIRNIIGDTNCNLFQIGSETADDIKNICVDNIYVLGANKAGFSISTNDGGHVRDVHLNCAHTGAIHSRSKMLRTRTPFFISISNRGRVLGAVVDRYQFDENGKVRDEILVKNVNIGKIENIQINGVDVEELYAGSSYGHAEERWKAYDGSQSSATPIIAGYKLPTTENVKNGLDFRLPNGEHIGYIQDIRFHDVHVLSKGGHPAADTLNHPPELGVGQYNVANLKIQPAYGLWARHAKDLQIIACSFDYEKEDGRYAIFLDDVKGTEINQVKVAYPKEDGQAIGWRASRDIKLINTN